MRFCHVTKNTRQCQFGIQELSQGEQNESMTPGHWIYAFSQCSRDHLNQLSLLYNPHEVNQNGTVPECKQLVITEFLIVTKSDVLLIEFHKNQMLVQVHATTTVMHKFVIKT
jgi:hypothetical protein